MKRGFRLLCLGFLLITLSACSIKVAYNFLPFLMKWELGRYVDLNRDQKGFVNSELDEFHNWHRQHELPRYAAYLQNLQTRLQTEAIDGPWIHAETDKVQLMIDDSVNRLKPEIVALVSGFNEKQTQQVIDRFLKEQKKYREKVVEASEGKRRKRHRDRLMDYVKPFFGRLTPEQDALIETWLDNVKPYEALSIKQQNEWMALLENAFAVRNEASELTLALNAVMFYRTDDWDPELEAVLDHNQKISYQLMADLYNSQTEKQRVRTFRKLEKYQKDLSELSRK